MLKSTKISLKENIDVIILFFLFLVLHMFMRFISWDDPYFLSELKNWNYDLLALTMSRYMSWTSRSIIEMVTFTLGALPILIWRILDSIAVVCFYLLLRSLLSEFMGKYELETKTRLVTMLIFLCWPFSTMGTTGWFSSATITLWTILGVLYTAIILHKAIYGKTRTLEKVIWILGLIYSANHESTYPIYLLLFIIMTYSCVQNKRRGLPELIIAWIIFLSNVAWALLAPGNVERLTGTENKTGYLSVSILGKIRMGINTTFYHYISVPNAILFILCLLIFLFTLKRKGNPIDKICGTLPLVIDIIWTGYTFFAYTLPRKTLTYIYPDENFLEANAIEQYAAMISALLLIILIIYNICNLIASKKNIFFLIATLILGLLPELELGFTPAISASILRVVIYLYAAFMIIILGLLHEKKFILTKLQSALLFTCITTGSVMNLLQIIRHMCIYG